MSESINPDTTVDSRGATCPGPLMDLIGKVKEVDEGTVIELLTSDAGSVDDVPDWLDESGHELVEMEEGDDHWTIYVKKT